MGSKCPPLKCYKFMNEGCVNTCKGSVPNLFWVRSFRFWPLNRPTGKSKGQIERLQNVTNVLTRGSIFCKAMTH